jgi:sugar O-acyltransferase (sialic acid O-acetyltransferase NeuD family)
MKQILLIGGGGHCISCIDVIETENIYKIKGIILPSLENTNPVLGYKILGTDNDITKLTSDIPNILICIGQIKSFERRKKMFENLKNFEVNFPIIKSPNSHCSSHAAYGEGTIIMHNCTINANSKIGENCIVNNHSLIEHDVKIEGHCHISTGAIINGGVQIGEGSFIGSGSIIKENVKIGKGVIIGAGQKILKDISDGHIVTK